MLKSMTGFGRGEFIDEKLCLIVEMKAVNHRYNEIVVRMPRVLNSLEDRIRRQISNVVSRGRVDVFITLTDTAPSKCDITVDKEMVLAYNRAISEVAETIGAENNSVHDAQKIFYLLRSNGVINSQEVQSEAEQYIDAVTQATALALDNLLKMRQDEGNNIYSDLCGRIEAISKNLQVIEQRAPQVVEEFHKKINDRVSDLLKDYSQVVDKDRLLQEVAFFADRTSITEEIVRLHSHIKQFVETINLGTAVGRKLDFIIQEFNREVNTIASKANDFSVTQITVEMKSEIEKVREQIQNVE